MGEETGQPPRGRVIRQAATPLFTARDGEQVFHATLTADTVGAAGIGPDRVSGGWYRIAPGVTNHLDMHPDRDEFYFIHKGTAVIDIGGETHVMTAGDTVFVPRGVDHFIANGPDEPFELFYLFTPAPAPHPVRDPERYPVVEFRPG